MQSSLAFGIFPYACEIEPSSLSILHTLSNFDVEKKTAEKFEESRDKNGSDTLALGIVWIGNTLYGELDDHQDILK